MRRSIAKLVESLSQGESSNQPAGACGLWQAFSSQSGCSVVEEEGSTEPAGPHGTRKITRHNFVQSHDHHWLVDSFALEKGARGMMLN